MKDKDYDGFMSNYNKACTKLEKIDSLGCKMLAVTSSIDIRAVCENEYGVLQTKLTQREILSRLQTLIAEIRSRK